MTVNTKKKRGRGRPFPKGTSGNAAGRPVGSRNNATLAAQQLLDGEAEKLTRKAVELALAGDSSALRLCLERIIGPRKDRPIELELPPATKVQEIPAVFAAVIHAIGDGRITPAEGQILMGIVQELCKVLETTELEPRVKELEKVLEKEIEQSKSR